MSSSRDNEGSGEHADGERQRPDHERIREALVKARQHAQCAAVEAIAAARALLDAATIAATGRDAGTQRGVDVLAQALDDLAASLGGSGSLGGGNSALHDALYHALDAEIDRWEQRARSDVEARAVLRAFIGLREILWELGIQPSAREDAPRRTPAARPRAESSKSGRSETGSRKPRGRRAEPRVQRITVDG